MKKILLFLPLFLFLVFPMKTSALEEHEEYFNYALGTYSEQIQQYKYHLFFKSSYNWYHLILSTEPIVDSSGSSGNVSFNFASYTGKYIEVKLGNDFVADLSTITSSFTSKQIYYSDYNIRDGGGNLEFVANYAFVDTPLEPSPSPSIPPVEENVNSFLNEIPEKFLGEIPEEFFVIKLVVILLFGMLFVVSFVIPIFLVSKLLRR